jgi:hypothetical protein
VHDICGSWVAFWQSVLTDEEVRIVMTSLSESIRIKKIPFAGNMIWHCRSCLYASSRLLICHEYVWGGVEV